MQIRSTETIKQAVMAGMGISFLSAHTISGELNDKSLVVLDVQGFPFMVNWYLVHRTNKRLAPVAQAFRDYLLEEGADLIVRTLPAVVRPSGLRQMLPGRAARP
jgi:DNA-binding transcriptional LysR family regulator